MRTGIVGDWLLWRFFRNVRWRRRLSSSRHKMAGDEKAVFATVESANVVPARARIGGTVVELAVKEGDEVKQGQIVATVGDEKLALQMKSLDAQIAGLEAQLAQAQTDLDRAEDLFRKGTIPKTRSTRRAPPSTSRPTR